MLKSRQARLTCREAVRQVENIHKYYIAYLLTLERVQERDTPLKSRMQGITQVRKHARSTITCSLQMPDLTSNNPKNTPN
jgi:hypothetical protein